MENLTLPKAYPGNKYEQRVTIQGIADPSTVSATLRYGRGGRATPEQLTASTAKTPGATSTDVTLSRPEGFRSTGVRWLEISADGQVIRTATFIISYDTN